MKKWSLMACLGFGILLSACGTAPASSAPETTAAAAVSSGGRPEGAAATDTAEAAPATMEIQLLVGTLKLEGTELAVTQEQTAVLLPLWQQIRTLTMGTMRGPGGPDQTPAASTPTAAADDAETRRQIDELLDRIQSAMTSAQLREIAQMQITQGSAASTAQELLGAMGGFPGGGQNPQPGTSQGGGGPQGSAPGGGRQRPDSGNGTQFAPGGNFPGGRSGGWERMLLEALIRTLQTRAGGTPTSQQAGTE
jgi:hypothetical protein